MGSPRARRFRGPAGSRRCRRPPSASTRSASPRRPVPRAPVRAADPVVGDLDDRAAVGPLHADAHRARLGVLGDVGQRLRDDVVGGGLDAVGEPLGQADVELERQPRAVGELLERGAQAALGEDAGVDALGELAQLAERVGERRARLRRAAAARRPGRASSRESASPSVIAIDTSRCWVPSWRSRSIRRRSSCAASTIRAREARSSSSRARSSACRRSFSSASPAAAPAEATSSGSSASAGSWTSAAIRRPSRSHLRHRPLRAVRAASTGRPSAST